MSNTVNWFFTLKTLTAANDRISDGRKVGVSVECLLASYSFKYFGKDSGVSIYTFIDDSQVLFDQIQKNKIFVNLHGEFDFKRKAANESFFNLAKILALKVS